VAAGEPQGLWAVPMGREAVRVQEQFRRGQAEGLQGAMVLAMVVLEAQVDFMVAAAVAEDVLLDRLGLDILVFLPFANFKGDRKWNFLYK